jgi:hypothetical protein
MDGLNVKLSEINLVKTTLCLTALCVSFWLRQGQAQLVILEPDNYANGTVLNHIIPEVSLITAGNNNLPHPPVPFDVRATTSTFPFTPPTGINVFAHAGGIPFWYTDRRLRMDFAGTVSDLSIDFQGGTTGVTERGTLQAYSAQNILLDTYVTSPLLGGQIERMSIHRASPDVAYAIAYALPGQTAFGRLDNLAFSVPVPEPSALWLLGIGLLGVVSFRARSRASTVT